MFSSALELRWEHGAILALFREKAAFGTVAGITVAYIPPVLGAVNLGFAVPAPTVTDVVDELLADCTADHAYLGLQLGTVTPRIAQGLGLPAERGAAVIAVEADGPAAGTDIDIDIDIDIDEGDVITAIDGEPVENVGSLLTQLRQFDPGDEVTLTD